MILNSQTSTGMPLPERLWPLTHDLRYFLDHIWSHGDLDPLIFRTQNFSVHLCLKINLSCEFGEILTNAMKMYHCARENMTYFSWVQNCVSDSLRYHVHRLLVHDHTCIDAFISVCQGWWWTFWALTLIFIIVLWVIFCCCRCWQYKQLFAICRPVLAHGPFWHCDVR